MTVVNRITGSEQTEMAAEPSMNGASVEADRSAWVKRFLWLELIHGTAPLLRVSTGDEEAHRQFNECLSHGL